MRALVTGGTGFVGKALVSRLLDDGWEVTVLTREPGRIAPEHQGRVAVLVADLAGELPLLPPVEVLVHCAAPAMGAAPSVLQAVQVAGTHKLLEAARHAGVKRFVHVSSQVVYGLDSQYYNADEATPLRPSRHAYCEAMRQAELAVWDAHHVGLPVVVVRPGFVYGPGDRHALPRLVQALREGKLKAHIDWGEFDIGCLHIENLVQGLMLAVTRPKALGQAYHLGDGRIVTYRHAADSLCRRLALPAPQQNLPYPMAKVLSVMAEGAWRLFKLAGAPPLTRFWVDLLHRNGGFSIAKAKRELGYAPRRHWDESLEGLGAWLEAESGQAVQPA